MPAFRSPNRKPWNAGPSGRNYHHRGTFVVRALAIQFNWGTKSLYRPDVPGVD
jgi:hypothetical protein